VAVHFLHVFLRRVYQYFDPWTAADSGVVGSKPACQGVYQQVKSCARFV
jgi:hypothetical protein